MRENVLNVWWFYFIFLLIFVFYLILISRPSLKVSEALRVPHCSRHIQTPKCKKLKVGNFLSSNLTRFPSLLSFINFIQVAELRACTVSSGISTVYSNLRSRCCLQTSACLNKRSFQFSSGLLLWWHSVPGEINSFPADALDPAAIFPDPNQ